LRRNGFDTLQDTSGFYWLIPAELNGWRDAGTPKGTQQLHTGKPSESGSVRHSNANIPPGAKTERALYDVIARNPGKHPREYALQIGTSPASVSSAARGLRKRSLIRIDGRTIAATYHLANTNGKTKTVVVVEREKSAKPQVDATISEPAKRRVLIDKETGEEFIYENGTLYREVVRRERVE
jgi:hypothetical protein